MQRGLRAAARARLRELGGGDATHPWPTLVLAHATLDDDAATAIRLYEAAAAGFAGQREAEGEVIARQNLRILYQRRGAHAAAAQQVELAVAAAEASALPLTIARASVLQAGHLTETGGDVGAARLALLRAERHAFPDGPISLRRAILFSLANAQLVSRAPGRRHRHAGAAPGVAQRRRVRRQRRRGGLQPAQRAGRAGGSSSDGLGPNRARPARHGRRRRSRAGLQPLRRGAGPSAARRAGQAGGPIPRRRASRSVPATRSAAGASRMSAPRACGRGRCSKPPANRDWPSS